MGINNFWEIVSPCIERVPASDLSGKKVAVDLAWWVVSDKQMTSKWVVSDKQMIASKNTVLNKETQNFHIRNLFYRVKRLLQLGVQPIFVLDGVAPDLKLKTIASRLGVGSVKSGARTFLRRQFEPCCQLLESMGVTWCQASNEAEKLCAALQAAGYVDAVLSADGDSICFGATSLYRSFSSESDAEIEKETMKIQVQSMD